jgi:hypothetical protein
MTGGSVNRALYHFNTVLGALLTAVYWSAENELWKTKMQNPAAMASMALTFAGSFYMSAAVGIKNIKSLPGHDDI